MILSIILSFAAGGSPAVVHVTPATLSAALGYTVSAAPETPFPMLFEGAGTSRAEKLQRMAWLFHMPDPAGSSGDPFPTEKVNEVAHLAHIAMVTEGYKQGLAAFLNSPHPNLQLPPRELADRLLTEVQRLKAINGKPDNGHMLNTIHIATYSIGRKLLFGAISNLSVQAIANSPLYQESLFSTKPTGLIKPWVGPLPDLALFLPQQKEFEDEASKIGLPDAIASTPGLQAMRFTASVPTSNPIIEWSVTRFEGLARVGLELFAPNGDLESGGAFDIRFPQIYGDTNNDLQGQKAIPLPALTNKVISAYLHYLGPDPTVGSISQLDPLTAAESNEVFAQETGVNNVDASSPIVTNCITLLAHAAGCNHVASLIPSRAVKAVVSSVSNGLLSPEVLLEQLTHQASCDVMKRGDWLLIRPHDAIDSLYYQIDDRAIERANRSIPQSPLYAGVAFSPAYAQESHIFVKADELLGYQRLIEYTLGRNFGIPGGAYFITQLIGILPPEFLSHVGQQRVMSASEYPSLERILSEHFWTQGRYQVSTDPGYYGQIPAKVQSLDEVPGTFTAQVESYSYLGVFESDTDIGKDPTLVRLYKIVVPSRERNVLYDAIRVQRDTMAKVDRRFRFALIDGLQLDLTVKSPGLTLFSKIVPIPIESHIEKVWKASELPSQYGDILNPPPLATKNS